MFESNRDLPELFRSFNNLIIVICLEFGAWDLML